MRQALAACEQQRAKGKEKTKKKISVAWPSSSTADGHHRLRVKNLAAKPWQNRCAGKGLMMIN